MAKLVKAEKPDNRELDALWLAIHKRVADHMTASFKCLGFTVTRVNDSHSGGAEHGS